MMSLLLTIQHRVDRLDSTQDEPAEQHFYQQALAYLDAVTPPAQKKLLAATQKWLISSMEVEYGDHVLGTGGL